MECHAKDSYGSKYKHRTPPDTCFDNIKDFYEISSCLLIMRFPTGGHVWVYYQNWFPSIPFNTFMPNQSGGRFADEILDYTGFLPSRLSHWGRETHICVSQLTNIGSDNGLSPGRRQAIIWNNAGLLLNEPLGTNFSEISIRIQTFSFKKMHLNMSSAKWRPLCLGLNVLTHLGLIKVADVSQTKFSNVFVFLE